MPGIIGILCNTKLLIIWPFSGPSTANTTASSSHAYQGGLLRGLTSNLRRNSHCASSSVYKQNHPPTFVVTNCFRDKMHRNSLGVVIPKRNNHRSRSFEANGQGNLPTFYFDNDDSRRHSISNCSRLLGKHLQILKGVRNVEKIEPNMIETRFWIKLKISFSFPFRL